MAEAMLSKCSYNGSSFLSSEVLTTVGKKKRTLSSASNDKYPDNKGKMSSITRTSTSDTTTHRSDDNDERRDSNSDEKSEKRSVVIETPSLTKRRRIIGNYSAADIVQVLNHAMSKEDRIDALENAVATFDHNDRNLHDAEIEAGVDIALVKHLAFLEFKTGFRREPIKCDMEEITQEIGSVLKSLECVYRASSDAVGKSFNRVGKDLLQILVILIDDEIKNRLQVAIPSSSSDDSESSSTNSTINNNHNRSTTETNNEELAERENRSVIHPQNQYRFSHVHDLLLRKSTKIIGHFARVGRATRPMARFPSFLGSILNLCNIRPYSTIPFEARLSCLWTIANLACNTDNMAMMICTPKLVDSLITISNRQPSSGDTIETVMEIIRAKSIASRTVLNLSWSPENKSKMSENVALVQALCKVALERQAPYKNSKTMQNILVQTRRHSLASLRNISAVPNRRKIALCDFNDGKLLDILTDVVLNETDQTAIDHSFSAIHNLTIHDTAEAIVDRAALVIALKNVLMEDTNDSQERDILSVKCQCASATILVLERAITPNKPSYEHFRELLDTTINPSNPIECTDESISLNATAV